MTRFACLAAMALAACVNPALVKVGYDGAVGRASDRSASLRMASGRVDMQSATYVRPSPAQYFNLDDQRVFGESLRAELNRLRMLRVGEVSWQDVREPGEVAIELTFQRTVYFPVIQAYALDVALQLRSGARTFARRYRIDSREGEGLWAKMNTDAGEGKALAARKLMARLIPDIDAFLASLD